MAKTALVALVVAVSLWIRPAGAEDDYKELKQGLQGRWHLALFRTPKGDMSNEKIKKAALELVIKDAKIGKVVGGKAQEAASFTLGRKGSNYTIDTTNKKGITELGLLALHDDVLLLCTARRSGVKRPTKFNVEGDEQHVLMVWKRVKKK